MPSLPHNCSVDIAANICCDISHPQLNEARARFYALLRPYVAAVMHRCGSRFVEDDASFTLQHLIFDVFPRRGPDIHFSSPERLRGFVRQACTFTLNDQRRRRKEGIRVEACYPELADHRDSFAAVDNADLLSCLRGRLRARERPYFDLMCVGAQHQEMARLFGVAERTAQHNCQMIRKKLQRYARSLRFAACDQA